MPDPTLIAEIRKSRREVVRITRQAHHDSEIIGVRVWFQTSDGEMRPGNAGISFRSDLAAAIGRHLIEEASASQNKVREG